MAVRRLKAVLEAVDKATPTLKRVSRGLAVLGGVAATVGVVQLGRKLVTGMQAAIKKSAEQELQERKLRAALISTGQASEALFESLKQQAAGLQSVTDVGDETTLQIQAMLIQFGVATDKVTALSEATLDLAKTFGIDYLSAATLVSKAVAGNVGALSRYGVSLDSVDVKARGATAVLVGLQRQFGGRARAEADTYAGAIEKMSNAWGDAQEKVGDFVVKSKPIRGLIEQMTGAAEDLGGELETLKSDEIMGEVIEGLGKLAKLSAVAGVTALNAAASYKVLGQTLTTGLPKGKQIQTIANFITGKLTGGVAGGGPTIFELGAAMSDSARSGRELEATLAAIQTRYNTLTALMAKIDEVVTATVSFGEGFEEAATPVRVLGDEIRDFADLVEETIPYMRDEFAELSAIMGEGFYTVSGIMADSRDMMDGWVQDDATYTKDTSRNARLRIRWSQMERDQKIQHVTQSTASAGGALRTLFGETKAGAYAGAIVNTAMAITNGLAVPPPPLGIALAAIMAAAGAVQLNEIRKTNFGGAAMGGIVPGADRGVDSVFGMLRPGEMVLPKDLSDFLVSSAGGGGGQPVSIHVSADSGDLMEVLNLRVQDGTGRLLSTELVGSRLRR